MEKKKTRLENGNVAGRNCLSDSIFNLLIDYYTEVPCRPYGSGATRENILPAMQALKPGFVVVYAKGHSGRTTFRSSLHTEHEMLAKDMPAFYRQVTREAGVKLFLYYSGLVDGAAAIRHPEWRMKDREGRDLAGSPENEVFLMYPLCPQSPYFEEWVSVHLREMIPGYDPDGIWVDGDWPGPCYCSKCESRYRKELNLSGALPDPEAMTPEADGLRKAWAAITREYRRKFRGLVKSLKPDCLYSAGNVNPRLEDAGLFDWRSGDCFSPNNHRIQMSLAMRRYTTQPLPYEAMTCDTSYVHSWKEMRSRAKMLPRMLQEGATLLANGAKWCYWTYPMPHGSLVPSKMANAGKAAEFARERTDLFSDTKSLNWTAVLNTGHAWVVPSAVEAAVYGAGKALIGLHRSPDIIDEDNLTGRIPYDLIVLPEQVRLTGKTVGVLEEFVRKGGKLLSSGSSINSPELQELLGVKLLAPGVMNEGHLFRKGGKPVGIFTAWDQVKPEEAKMLYPLYRSWDYGNEGMKRFNPNYPIDGLVDEENPEEAGFPAATIRKMGKGAAVHVAAGIFGVYWKYGYPEILTWIEEMLESLQPNPLFKTDALSFVEVALRLKGDDLLVHFVNGNPGRDLSLVNTRDLWVDDIPAVGPITSWIRCARNPRKVSWGPGGERAENEWRDGVLKVVLPRLEIHSCLVVSGWKQ